MDGYNSQAVLETYTLGTARKASGTQGGKPTDLLKSGL